LIANVSLGVSLLLALVLVFVKDRSRPPRELASVKPSEVQNPPLPQPESPPRVFRLGVTPVRPEFDDMGTLLKSLGEGYKYHAFPLDDLGDPKALSEYNIIFLTCSGVPKSWVKEETGKPAAREGFTVVEVDEGKMKQVSENLKQFVSRGGTLYASDLHFGLVAGAFPELVDHRRVNKGRVQSLTAEVVDPGLRELIGAELPLKFDQPDWRPAAFTGEEVVTILRGDYQDAEGKQQTAPLLVKFPCKDGAVIFTSFHNEKQNSEAELKLLRYLVFAAVTAGVESRARSTMIQGGFKPARGGIFSASKGGPSVTQTYRCAKEADLRFVLAFESQGARLKFTVTGPGGKVYTEEGTSTLTIDVPKAAPGDWKYTVTAVQLPHENFAYTVTVGEK
jgi:hypothetical protein